MTEQEGSFYSSDAFQNDSDESSSDQQGMSFRELDMNREIAKREAERFYHLLNTIGDQAASIAGGFPGGYGTEILPGFTVAEPDTPHSDDWGVFSTSNLVGGLGAGGVRISTSSWFTTENGERIDERYYLEIERHTDEKTLNQVLSLMESNPSVEKKFLEPVGGLRTVYHFGESGEFQKCIACPPGVMDNRKIEFDYEDGWRDVYADMKAGDFELVGFALQSLQGKLQQYLENK